MGRRAERETASAAVRSEWARRIEAEYRSAAVTQHLVHWMIVLGLSPDLVHEGLGIVQDEMEHARQSHRTFVAAGGEGMPLLERESLFLRRHDGEPLEVDAARVGVEVFCLGETVAVPLFKVLREGCTVPAARRTLDRVLKDEVRHRDFGWALLDALLALPSHAEIRAVVDRELPAMLARQRRNYAPEGAGLERSIPAEDRAWGLMPTARYAEVLERALDRDYAPRFRKRGFDVRAAWHRG